jgi:hypothetical protein
MKRVGPPCTEVNRHRARGVGPNPRFDSHGQVCQQTHSKQDCGPVCP